MVHFLAALWVAVIISTMASYFVLSKRSKRASTVQRVSSKGHPVLIALLLNFVISGLRIAYFVDPLATSVHSGVSLGVLFRAGACVITVQWCLIAQRWWELGNLRTSQGFLHVMEGGDWKTWIITIVVSAIVFVAVTVLTIFDTATTNFIARLTLGIFCVSALLSCSFVGSRAVTTLLQLALDHRKLTANRKFSIHHFKAFQVGACTFMTSLCALLCLAWSYEQGGGGQTPRDSHTLNHWTVVFVLEAVICHVVLYASFSPPPFQNAIVIVFEGVEHVRERGEMSVVFAGVLCGFVGFWMVCDPECVLRERTAWEESVLKYVRLLGRHCGVGLLHLALLLIVSGFQNIPTRGTLNMSACALFGVCGASIAFGSLEFSNSLQFAMFAGMMFVPGVMVAFAKARAVPLPDFPMVAS